MHVYCWQHWTVHEYAPVVTVGLDIHTVEVMVVAVDQWLMGGGGALRAMRVQSTMSTFRKCAATRNLAPMEGKFVSSVGNGHDCAGGRA